MMPLLQLVGILAMLGTVGATSLSLALWLATRRRHWSRMALLVPAGYLGALLVVSWTTRPVVLPPGGVERFCGFYLDCHLSVRVTGVERAPSAWTATLEVANDARRASLVPVGFEVELLRPDSGAVRVVPMGAGLDDAIPPGETRRVTVSFAAPRNGATPSLRVTEGYGVDRVIEAFLLGDDDALGRHRVTLGL